MERNAYRPAAAPSSTRRAPAQKRPPARGAPEEAPVVMNLTPPEEPAPQKKSRWWIWLIVGILVVGIGVAVGFFLLSPKEEEEAPEVVEEPQLTYGITDPVVFENEECAFIIDEVGEKGDYLELDVRCVNKTEGPLTFTWESTCINGSMFDPLWETTALGKSTMKSSITFPLSTLEEHNLLPANEIKYILRIYDEFASSALRAESSKYIMSMEDAGSTTRYKNFRKIKGYDGYFFSQKVKVDDDNRPYYVRVDEETEEEEKIYFDEIYDLNGNPRYPIIPDTPEHVDYYNDELGRPYYFSKNGDTIYYDGFGFAFSDPVTGKNYFYDEDGNAAFYGFNGVPEYYTKEIPQDLVEAGKPRALAKAADTNIVHKEFVLYPTGLNAEELEYPNRIFATSEEIYWAGEKGNFIVLGGTMDEFQGYIVHTYIENRSDNYIYFGWNGAVVNGASTYPNSISVLRPHSNIYRDVVIPIELLKEQSIKNVEEIKFRVFAVGENLSVPLYPIVWEAKDITGVTE